MYVDSSRIFAVLNCLFNIHNDSAFVYVQYALTSLIPRVGFLLSFPVLLVRSNMYSTTTNMKMLSLSRDIKETVLMRERERF